MLLLPVNSLFLLSSLLMHIKIYHLHIHSFHHLSTLPLFKVTLNGFTAGLDDMKKLKV